jgi:amylosucrase
VHRPRADRERYERRNDPETLEGRVYQGLKKLVDLRKSNSEFSGSELKVIASQNEHVLAYLRSGQVLVLANFSERPQEIASSILEQAGLTGRKLRLHGISEINRMGTLSLAPYDFLVIK